MLEIGDIAPDIQLEPGSLYELLDRGPVVVYFYPADFSPVCTAQACMIRDLYSELAAAGITVIGVSPQGKSMHDRFKSMNRLPFHLVADAGMKVTRAYKSMGMFGLPIPFGVRRVTYLIGKDRRVLDRATGELGIGAHSRMIKAAAAGGSKPQA
jgi:peroxiredoxin Q/BCP